MAFVQYLRRPNPRCNPKPPIPCFWLVTCHIARNQNVNGGLLSWRSSPPSPTPPSGTRATAATSVARHFGHEASHGSLLRGLAAVRGRARRRAAGRAEAHDGRLTTLENGIQTLVDALAAALGERLRTGVRVEAVADRGRPGDGPMTLHASTIVGGERFEADVAVAALGFDRVDVPTVLYGYGLLSPRGEGVRTLGVLWSSAVFPDQAPPGKVTLSVIGGGTLDPGLVALDDATLLAAVRRDLKRTMGIVAEPEAVRIVRWPRGVAQYALGHRKRVDAARRALAARWPLLALVGDYLSGLGMNDVAREAREAATWLTGVPRV